MTDHHAKSSLSRDFTVFESTPGMRLVFLPDPPHFTILAATGDICKHVNSTKELLVGKSIFEAFPSNPFDPTNTGERDLRASLDHVLVHNEPHQLPLQRYDIKEENGSFTKRYWKVGNFPVTNDEGQISHIIHVTEDITEQVEAGEIKERMKGVEQAHNLFLHAPIVIGILRGKDHVLELANEDALKLWNKTEAIIGKPLLEAIPELKGQDAYEQIDRVYRTGQPYRGIEAPISSIKDEKEHVNYFDVYYKPYYDVPGGPVSGVFTLSYDVTQKVLAEKKAEESEDRFRVLADQAPVLIFMADTNAAVTYWNKYWLEYTGQSFEKALGRAWEEVVHPDDYDNLLTTYLTATNKQQSYSVEARIRGVDGEYRYFFFTGGPRYTHDGKLLGNIGTGIDMHERKKTEEALKKSELNLRNTILQSPFAIAILKGPSHIVEIANDRMYELWGRGKEDLLNKSIFQGLPEVKDQGYEELLNGVYNTGKRYAANSIPVTLPRSSGIETVYINLLYEAYREADGSISGIIAVAIDVTDQVLARIKVEEINKEFRFVTDFMPQMIWITRPDGYHYYYNKQWYDYTGLTYGETEGEGWNQVFHPDDREAAWKQWGHSLKTGEPYEIEYRCRRYDGEYRWVLGRALALKDEAGNILKWFGTCTDIDDQKREAQSLEEKVKERTLELESQKRELERSNANLEDFAYAASHDLKEPIRKIQTFSNRLKHKLQDRLLADDQHYFERMQNATERMQLLIEDLLEYSHVSAKNTHSEEIDMGKKVAHVLDDLELEIAEKSAKIFVDELPIIKGNRPQIQQLFQNLITNALKFQKPNVNPEIRISSTTVSGEDTNLFTVDEDSKNKRYNLIQVSDNGIGFEQEHADKIFKMFQRLHGKAEYSGTGIGLAIVRKVVENHKGFIVAESKPGEGATFKIYLPVEL